MLRDRPRRVFVTVNALAADRENLRAFAMAAAVLGVPLRAENDFVITRRVQDGKTVEHVAWYLEPKSRCRRYKTPELWQHWNDPEWLAANATHPLAVLRDYAQALADAAAHERAASPIAVFSRGRRHAFIPLDLPLARKKQLMEMLEK